MSSVRERAYSHQRSLDLVWLISAAQEEDRQVVWSCWKLRETHSIVEKRGLEEAAASPRLKR